MKLTLKNVKHSEFASQETNCFEATVYADGKPMFIASNDGQGGSNRYDWIKGDSREQFDTKWAKVEAYAKSLNLEFDFEEVDQIVGDLLTDWLIRRDMKRLMNKRILFTRKDKKGLYELRYKGRKNPHKTRVLLDAQKQVARPDVAAVLNLLDEDCAFEIFKREAA